MDGEFFYILQMAANFMHEHPLTFRIVSAGIPLIVCQATSFQVHSSSIAIAA